METKTVEVRVGQRFRHVAGGERTVMAVFPGRCALEHAYTEGDEAHVHWNANGDSWDRVSTVARRYTMVSDTPSPSLGGCPAVGSRWQVKASGEVYTVTKVCPSACGEHSEPHVHFAEFYGAWTALARLKSACVWLPASPPIAPEPGMPTRPIAPGMTQGDAAGSTVRHRGGTV